MNEIDCSLAFNYVVELDRMCNSQSTCNSCKLAELANGLCRAGQAKYPQKAIEIVQAWSDEHPREKVVTYLDKLLEVFPNTHLYSDGTPKGNCPSNFGLKTLNCSDSCIACWNQPYKENTNE